MDYKFSEPIKMPRGSHYGADYWISPSYKLNRNVISYSLLEHAAFLEFEMNPAIKYFCEQPLQAELLVAGKMRKTVFDFYVVYIDGTEAMIECKYESELQNEDKKSLRTQEQISRQKEWCRINKFEYKIITDNELLNSFRNTNLIILAGYIIRHNEILDIEPYFRSLQNLFYLNNVNKLPIKVLIDNEIFPPNHIFNIISYLYYSGKITLNIDTRPLDNSTEVYLINGK